MASGFYDRSIIGGGDRIMLGAFTGHYGGVRKKFSRRMARHVVDHGRSISALVGPANISYTPGVVLHIWHGDLADRDYRNRYQILLDNDYAPDEDVRVNGGGMLEWSSDKPSLHRQVSDYFSRRKEGPKPNATAAVAPFPDEEGGVGVGVGGASRAVQSYSGYHCRRADYKAACRSAFRLWGETLQALLLAERQKELAALAEKQRALQAEQRRKSDAARRSRTKKKHSGAW